ncbi:disease resistance protein RPV1-like [Hibiscus syriacus]|uniref:disease resistance protein RPV1-like n=1 Tax=Hibiscus syriacus TaxID=106335 RepID=UPI0019242823|nr:disease resistance protein RPV1-like [Hibiscus syriacus]
MAVPTAVMLTASMVSLYVGDLHPVITDGTLFNAFNSFKGISSVRVCGDSSTGRSLCYGYVNFSSLEDAHYAMEKMNHSSIHGKMIRVAWSLRDPDARKSGVGNVFVKNLSESIDSVGLQELFQRFGNVISCKAATFEDGKSKCYRFVQFESEESATAAIEKLDNNMIGDKQVFVGKFMKTCDRILPSPDVNIQISFSNLIETPDFTIAPNLEILILEGCTRIVDVHPSVGVLTRLKLLNLRSCTSLRNLPTKIGIESLETLILKDCRNLISLPSSIGGCKCLKTLDLSGFYKVENLPENLQQVELLEELDLSETAIAKLPSFIFQLKNLKVLSLNRLKGPSSNIGPNLTSLFQVSSNIESVPLMLHSLSGLRSLRELKLRNCNLHEGDIPSDISCLSSLEKLELGGNSFISIPVLGTGLSRLQYLGLSNCRELKSFPKPGASRELFATPSKVCNAVDWTQFSGLHCYRLVENINALTLLKFHLKRVAYLKKFLMLLYLEVKYQNGSAIKQLTLQSRYHCLTIFRMMVNGSELLSAVFLSTMTLQGMRNSHVKLLSIIRIPEKMVSLHGRMYSNNGDHAWLHYKNNMIAQTMQV